MKPGTRPERVGLSEATLSKETSFKGKVLQAVVDSWCKIQVIIPWNIKIPLDPPTKMTMSHKFLLDTGGGIIIV